MGLLFSLKTHREFFASADHAEADEPAWPIGLALAVLPLSPGLVELVRFCGVGTECRVTLG